MQMEGPRLLDMLLREYIVHVGKGARQSSALLEEDVHNPSSEESQVAKPCPVLAHLKRGHVDRVCVGEIRRAEGEEQNLEDHNI